MKRSMKPFAPGGGTDRRRFLAVAGMALAGAWKGNRMAAAASPSSLEEWLSGSAFDAFVRARMEEGSVPGLSLAVIDGGRVAHEAGFGWADFAAQRAMEPATLINIASITKTLTCTAVMQLRDRGLFRLDDDVDAHLPFSVRNPAFPATPVTFRQLLTHASSIADGPAYEAIYVCGDPQRSLAVWLADYFSTGGAAYDREANFHTWAPGSRYDYSNVAFGVLGLLVERLSGMEYTQYCAKHIFTPLGMERSRFLLEGMDRSQHATPYIRVTDGNFSAVALRDPAWNIPTGVREAQAPLCLYSFVTMPDGLARTSAAELARFLLAYMKGGALHGKQLLSSGTVAEILARQPVSLPGEGGSGIGLAWHHYAGGICGHTGSDPGVATSMKFDAARGRGVVVLTNSDDGREACAAITKAIFER